MLCVKTVFVPTVGRCVEAELFGGQHLLDCLIEGAALGQRLECGVCFLHNGRFAWIFPGIDPEEHMHWLEHQWETAPLGFPAVP